MRSLITALLCLAAACASVAAAPALTNERNEPPTVAEFALLYERAGGLKPMPQKLVVRPGRHAVAESAGTRAGAQRARFRIAKKTVLILQERLAAAEFDEIESPLPGNCADCYLYEIRYRGHSVLFPQSEIPPRLSGLIGQIEAIVYARTIPPNARG